MAIDDRDRIWMVETGVQPNNFLGFDPQTKKFFATSPIASGGGSVRHMYFHAPTKEIWFGTDRGTIGRARLP
jgi:virginiamycin B lyase